MRRRLTITVLITVLYPLIRSKSTIEDTKQLFRNTISRWKVKVNGPEDYKQRYARLIAAKASVDQTTTGVLLDSLNRFAVNNDEEQAVLMRVASQEALNFTQAAVTEPSTYLLGNYGEALPEEYQYWEKELGMSHPQDHGNSCSWPFPVSAAMEAVYRELTGEYVVFSKQYFVDCTLLNNGCGGRVNDGYKITRDRQYLMSEGAWPYTAEYQSCKFKKQIETGENNAMRKTWLQDWLPLRGDETGMLEGLMLSPVTFTSLISSNYQHYSGGLYDDASCAEDFETQAQLLVGYTKEYLRVRGSYGKRWGDGGYINYKRGSPNLLSCNFYKAALSITMTHSRDIVYEYCNQAKVSTRAECAKSCRDMNKEGETGWVLATIPTRNKNDFLVKKVNSDYPGVKKDDKFNLLWIGLTDPQLSRKYTWSDGYTDVGYFNYTRETGSGKYGLLNKNTGGWRMKSSQTFQARGLCSKATTCWDIRSAIKRGSVKFSTDTLVEGTKAKVSCEKKCEVKGPSKLTCAGGQWNGDDVLPYCECQEKNDNDM